MDKQVGCYASIGNVFWNDNAKIRLRDERDRLADMCVKRGLKPDADTLVAIVRVPLTGAQTQDSYSWVGSVGWKVTLRG